MMEENIPKFIVYSAGYNCAKYVPIHMESIRNQTFQDYVHILVDDASTDNTYEILNNQKNDHNLIYRNTDNLRWLHNSTLYLTPNIASEEQIIVLVDMDDWLAHDNVLRDIYNIYQEEKVWLTYGQFVLPDGITRGHARPAHGIIQMRTYRRSPWIFQHLQTFKAFLWLNLDEEDFRLSNGHFAPCAYDRAVMYPLLEMCKPEKIRFVKDIVYIYNLNNPLCLEKIDRNIQIQCEMYFRNKPSYNILARD
jgi:glycosyltransferase involved in cell wall biosynthesis